MNKDLYITRLVLQRYTMRQILHIVANKNKEPQAYEDYFAYCEQCKTKVIAQMAQEQLAAEQLAAKKEDSETTND